MLTSKPDFPPQIKTATTMVLTAEVRKMRKLERQRLRELRLVRPLLSDSYPENCERTWAKASKAVLFERSVLVVYLSTAVQYP